MIMRAWWQTVTTLWLVAWSAVVMAAPAIPQRVSLATMAPGTEFWSAFGHNALILEYPDQPAQSYNFGYFDFEEPGFLQRFLFGAMEYLAVAWPARNDLHSYRMEARAVVLQELALDESQRLHLAEHLHAHVQPERARYRYDYFRVNCSTKVRDALDLATGDAVSRAIERRSHGYTWRSLALAQSRDVLWMYLGMHAGLGLPADQPLSIREETYVPQLLMQAVREVRLVDSEGRERALVAHETTLDGAPMMPATRTQPPEFWPWFLLTGSVWAVVLWRARGKWARVGAGLSALLLGLGGGLLVFFWAFTAHWAAAWNQNLVLFNPFYLGLALLAVCPVRDKVLRRGAGALLLLGAVGSFAKVLPAFSQQNIEWVMLLLPVQWGIWQVYARVRSA